MSRKPRLADLRSLLVGCLLIHFAGLATAAEPPVTALAFAPGGDTVVAVSQSGIAVLSWPELESIQTIAVTAPNLHCCVFSPNGKRFAIGGGYPAEEGVVKVYSWPELELLTTDTQHQDSVLALAWEDESHLVTASLDRSIRRINIEPKSPTMAQLSGHSRGVTALSLLSQSGTLVSGGIDQSLRVWNLQDGRVVRSLNQHTAPVHAMATRPTGDGLPMIASAAADRTIRFWQPTIGRMVRYARLPAEPLSIAWLNERQIVAACNDGRLRVVDSLEVSVVKEREVINGWAYSVAVHPSDGSVAVGGTNGVVRRITFDTE